MPTSRARAVRRVLVVEGLGNLLVALAKLVAGLWTGSLALVSDALHSTTDLANNVLAWFAMRVADEPPDDDHPYGHAKFETLAIFVLGTLMSVLAVEILLSVVRRGDVGDIATSPAAMAAPQCTVDKTATKRKGDGKFSPIGAANTSRQTKHRSKHNRGQPKHLQKKQNRRSPPLYHISSPAPRQGQPLG